MNKLWVEVGWKSINHVGEQLCGDHVEMAKYGRHSMVMVLADGLGSGVKASILSTLTSKIIATMIAQGMKLEDCVATIMDTLPVCSERGVAYSTFTILNIIENHTLEIIQYDNPPVIILRNNQPYRYLRTQIEVRGKQIMHTVISLMEGDCIIAMSDGCPHAGIGLSYNFGWKIEDIENFMSVQCTCGYNAKTLASMLIDECNKAYSYKPGDDATGCVIKMRKRASVNLLFGPPRDQNDSQRMMSLFFAKEGKHIISGGTTSSIAAKYLGKPVRVSLANPSGEIPPIAEIEGVDLVTEGVITINKVIEYARDFLNENVLYEEWTCRDDGASRICRMLFEEATDINLYVGRAMNPAHQNPNLPITFNIKMNLAEELEKCLTAMGKQVQINYF